MPATTYMMVDPRRDHSLRVPRPDLSVELGAPNACTACHLEPERISPEKRATLTQYADWIRLAESGDEDIKNELKRLDTWAAQTVEKWYGRKAPSSPEFAATLKAAWEGKPEARDPLTALALNRGASGMVRASAVLQMAQYASAEMLAATEKLLRDPEPQVRAAAIANLQGAPAETLVRVLPPLLNDPVRLVRTEAARVLAAAPGAMLDGVQRQALKKALDEFTAGVMLNNDRAFAWLTLGNLYESQGEEDRAIEAYRTAMRVEPNTAGPRTNLAALYDRMAETEERLAQQMVYQRNRDGATDQLVFAAEHRDQAQQLRAEELPLLARDAQSAPDNAPVQYRYGLALYLQGKLDQAEAALRRAAELEPNAPEFVLGLALLYQKLERWPEAVDYAERVLKLRPEDASYRQLVRELQQQSQAAGSLKQPNLPHKPQL
jgi:tetratricopeptide (TPR) repeat protein